MKGTETWTPRERLALQNMVDTNPHLQTLISRLALEALPSEAYKASRTISSTIDAYLQEFRRTRPRVVHVEDPTPQIFRTTDEISAWIKLHNFSL